MKRMFAVVRRPVICLLAIMGGAALTPTVCPAQSLCCPPFPLPHDLEVGDSWTYLNRWSSGTDTLIITINTRHELGRQTYFELSDGGLYRVDDERRTWKYDADTESEVLYWNIWDLWTASVPIPENAPSPTSREFDGFLTHNQFLGIRSINDDLVEIFIKPLIAKGEQLQSIIYPYIWRYGPYGLEELELASGIFIGNWTNSADRDEITWRELLIDWGVTEVYGFYNGFSEDHQNLIMAPEVGTLHYVTWTQGFFDEYVLLAKDQHVTAVEDISLGRLKKMHAESASKKGR